MTLDKLQEIPADAILGLMTAYRADPAPGKIDLTVGVYKDAEGHTPVMRAVAAAEERLRQVETTKSYISPLGVDGFLAGIRKMVLGPLDDALESRTSVIQTPGGCGALRVAAEIYLRTHTRKAVYLSTPTWGNHLGLMGAAGLDLEAYPYYKPESHQLDTEAMLETMSRIPEQSLIVLQASSHNPTGEDPDAETWDAIIDIVAERNLMPLFDLAYQGLGDGLDEDVASIRAAAQRLPEVFVAVSCSKNFGLYRERTGALLSIGRNESQKQGSTARAQMSRAESTPCHLHMAPSSSTSFFLIPTFARCGWKNWTRCEVVNGLRAQFADALTALNSDLDTGWIKSQRGMFSLLGLPTEQVDALSAESSTSTWFVTAASTSQAQ